MTHGRVVRILPASCVDGPGNRAVVFLAGCNFRCLACHNPQTIALCNGCGACLPVCPVGALAPSDAGAAAVRAAGPPRWDRDRCRQCDLCVEACPNWSTPKAVRLTPEGVMAELVPARPFLSGLTISGGEPTLQPEFAGELAALAQAAGLHTLIDSNGSAPVAVWEQLAPRTDGVILDVKASVEALHQRLTGHPLAPVLASADYLTGCGKLYEVRHLVIPGYTDEPGEVAALAGWLAAHAPGVPLALLAFRPYGVRGPLVALPSPTADRLALLAQTAREQGVGQVTVRGLLGAT